MIGKKTNDADHSKHLNDPWPEIVHNCRERNGVAQEKMNSALPPGMKPGRWNRSTVPIFSEIRKGPSKPHKQRQFRREVKGALPEFSE